MRVVVRYADDFVVMVAGTRDDAEALRAEGQHLVRRYLPGWEISDGGIDMFRPNRFAVERYRYQGTKIPTPWESETTGSPGPAA